MRGLGFTYDKIMEYVFKYGNFQLNWNYRVDGTRDKCKKLEKAGILFNKKSQRGLDEWVLTPYWKENFEKSEKILGYKLTPPPTLTKRAERRDKR